VQRHNGIARQARNACNTPNADARQWYHRRVLYGRTEVAAHSLPSPRALADVNFRRAIMGLGRHELTKQRLSVCVAYSRLSTKPTHVDGLRG